VTLHAPLAPAGPALTPSRRADGWTAAAQRRFLEAIADGQHVDCACRIVGLTRASAYAFRRSAAGAGFALGWRAASLVARDAVADALMVRAFDGQTDTYTRADGQTVTRQRLDNGLALRLLGRLDRLAETAPDADSAAARLVAQEFDAFLASVERDDGPARAGLFLARRAGGLAGEGADAARDLAPIYALAAADRLARTGVATAEEVPVADLDPAARADWTAEQWQRAEAAGLLALAVPPAAADAPGRQECQHSDGSEDPDAPVWWDKDESEWRTRFPPPPGFCGREDGDPADLGYQRELTEEEALAMGPGPDQCTAVEFAELAAARDPWFRDAAAARGLILPPPREPGWPEL
jgi:hypothetical protein